MGSVMGLDVQVGDLAGDTLFQFKYNRLDYWLTSSRKDRNVFFKAVRKIYVHNNTHSLKSAIKPTALLFFMLLFIIHLLESTTYGLFGDP